MQLTLIRNATLRLAIAGRTLLFDPYLEARGSGRSYAGQFRSPLVELPLPTTGILAGLEAVLVSHLHSDHFDEAARGLLPKDMPVLCRERDAPAIAEAGFSTLLPVETRREWRGLTIHATDGRHGPEPVLAELGAVSGFVVEAPGEPVLYLAGDSIWCPEVSAAIACHKPDVIVVHAAGANWRGHGPIVMDEAQVRTTLLAAPWARIVATHLDCVDHATVSRAGLRHAAGRWPDELHRRLIIPEDGQSLDFEA